jgi:hypothetical protein
MTTETRLSPDTPPTQEYILRAMSQNYADGNIWDRLDIEVCAKAADEIKRLREDLISKDRAWDIAMRRLDAAEKKLALDHAWLKGVTVADPVASVCKVLCQSKVFETGQGTCALICMEQLGNPRKRGCYHAARVHDRMAISILEALTATEEKS